MGGEAGSLWEESSSRRLIALISKRPALWDRACPDYTSRTAVVEAWRAVCGELEPGFRDMAQPEQDLYVKATTKRWKNIRDQWGKICRKIKEQKKCGLPPCRQYIYHEQLLFLDKTMSGFPSENDIFKLDDVENENSNSESFVYIKEENVLDDSNEKQSESTFQTKDLLDEQITTQEKESVQQGESNKQRNDTVQRASQQLDGSAPETRDLTEPAVQGKPTPRTESTRLTSALPWTEPKRSKREAASKEYCDESRLYFFKGLLPALRGFSDDEVLALQGGVISLIQNIKRARREFD